jgi:Putative peptidoglycan binding domain
MKKLPYIRLTKIWIAGFTCFALTTAVPLAQAGSEHLHSNTGLSDHHFGHDYYFFGPPSWWYAGSGPDNGSGHDAQYWHNLAIKVQSVLAHLGFYHGPINGVIDSESRHAIHVFQKTYRLADTGLVDPGLLKALQVPL